MDSQRVGGPTQVPLERVDRLEARLDRIDRSVSQIESALEEMQDQTEKQQQQIEEVLELSLMLFDYLEEAKVFNHGSDGLTLEHFDDETTSRFAEVNSD